MGHAAAPGGDREAGHADGNEEGHGDGQGRGPGRDVVIVGAGFAGTSVFLHLVRALLRPGIRTRTGPAARPVRSVQVVDPNPTGWGLAFGDSDPLLVCNSAADVNSLLADRPTDFIDYLRERGAPPEPQDCVPRARMAEYCHDRHTDARALAIAHGIEVRHVRDTAVSVSAGAGGHRVRLRGGQEITGDEVVVCTGVHHPRVPDGFADFPGHPRYLDSPYPAGRIRGGLPPGSRVLVLGTHQSAVDAALLLCRDGHRTTMASPSGLLPAVRRSLAAPVRDFPPLEGIARLDPADPRLEAKVTRCAVEAVRLLDRRPLRAQTSTAADPVRRLREETALVEAGACAWPGVVVPLLEGVIALSAGLPAARRRALIAHFAWFVDRYATALTVVNARRLLDHFETGALRMAPAYPRAVSFDDDAWRVQWPQRSPGGSRASFDYVVNATGFRPPELCWDTDGKAVHLGGVPGPAVAVDGLEADLRLRLRPGTEPEHIWVVGVGTHLRIPFSNHLRNVVRQARQVADEISAVPSGG
ncbi:FAD/NAD(P)-binding protein [Streptomyces netropsis]|uniref:FAD/NAD(P)-binding protein n=1 Tax=Streptomyces netropsis TaxID=55404 RepID=UPI0030CFA98D